MTAVEPRPSRAKPVISLAEGRRAPIPAGRRSSELLSHGSLEIRFYTPRGVDPQTPHTRDEVYVVVHGRGRFFRECERTPFGPGDLIFVPAGAEHRFEDFSDDLEVWVAFYGPEGGERPAS